MIRTECALDIAERNNADKSVSLLISDIAQVEDIIVV